MKKVIIRAITGTVYVGLTVGAILGGPLWFGILLSVFAILGVNEFNRITNRNFMSTSMRLLDMLGALAGIWIPATAVSMDNQTGEGLMAILGVCYFCYFILRFIAQLYVTDGNGLEHLAHSIMGQVYVVFPLMLLMGLYFVFGKALILLLFVLIWLNDTGAFCVGSMLGRHKLFERISPKKSWEGFFGGLVFCLLAGAAAYQLFHGEIAGRVFSEIWTLTGLGAVVCVFATWGDLVESLIKRSLGVKDSGNLLPGHGGILDRIDSLLLVVPGTILYIILLSAINL